MLNRTCRYVLLCLLSFSTIKLTAESSQQTADQFFMEGDFTQAKRSYLAIRKQDQNSVHALLRLGQIALLVNRLAEAERLLKKVLAIDPGNKRAKLFLAEAYVRGHKFTLAAQIDRDLG